MSLVLRFHRQPRRVTSPDHLPLGRRNSEAERSPQTLDVPLAHMPSLLTKQGGDAPIAVAWVLVAEFHHPLQQTLLPRGLLPRAGVPPFFVPGAMRDLVVLLGFDRCLAELRP